jgi:predicted component of type VI protein secretion system
MEAKLTVVAGKTNKSKIRLQLPTVIGRGRECRLCIAHPMVSRRHCELAEVEGLLVLRDLGSLNGTFIEEQRISEAALRPGDQFTIGPVTFRAEYEYHGDLSAIPAPKLAAAKAENELGPPPAFLFEQSGSVSTTNSGAAAKPPGGNAEDDDVVFFPMPDQSPEVQPAAATPARGAPAGKGKAAQDITTPSPVKAAEDEELDEILFEDLDDEPQVKTPKVSPPAPPEKKKAEPVAAKKPPAGPQRPAASNGNKPTPPFGTAKKPLSPAAEAAAGKQKPIAKPAAKKETPKAGPNKTVAAPAKPTPSHAAETDADGEPIDQAFEDFLKGLQ